MKRILIISALFLPCVSLFPFMAVASEASAAGEKSQVLEKLKALQADQKQILDQLAEMKKELYTIKVRASRC